MNYSYIRSSVKKGYELLEIYDEYIILIQE